MDGLFSFERSDGLTFVPLAARRALDLGGVRLSLDGWRSLPEAVRAALVVAGLGPIVDAECVRSLTTDAAPKPVLEPASPDEDSERVPAHVRQALGEERPLADAAWRGLSEIGRYSLGKLAKRDRSDRLGLLYSELVGAPR